MEMSYQAEQSLKTGLLIKDYRIMVLTIKISNRLSLGLWRLKDNLYMI